MISRLFVLLLISQIAFVSLALARSSATAGTIAIQDDNAPENQFQWKDDLNLSLKESAISGKPIFAKFEAVWCQPCQELTKEFEKPAFGPISEAAILLRVDVDQNPEIAEGYDVTSIPTILLLDSNGEIVAEKVGLGEVDLWVEWMKDAVKKTEFKMPDVLASNEPPTRTEIADLIERLGSRDPTMRQLTMERLAAFPGKTRKPLIESLQQPGKLSQKLSVLEVLDRWQAPVDGLDPWLETTFSAENLEAINAWKETPLEELETVLKELTAADLVSAKEEIDRLLISKNLRANLARLTRYGSKLLPTVYDRLEQSQSDEETSRLTALRYWLISSNELRLGWSGGIIELASASLDSRRTAATALIDRASLLDEPLLLELFADSDPLVRELSLNGLQRIGAKQTDATLARLLNDPDKNVRAAVLKQFATAKANHMASHVAKYLETETDTDLIVQALRFMKTASGDKSLAAVLQFMNHESWQVRAEVAEALGKIESSNLSVDMVVKKGEAVMSLLEDDDGFVVSRAVKSLPSEKDKRMLQTLTDIALRKPNIAKEIVESMSEESYSYSRSGRVSLAPYLLQFLDHENAAVRVAGINGYAKKYVEKISDEQFVKLLKDEEPNVRIEALNALLSRFEWIRKQAKGNSSGGAMRFSSYDESFQPSLVKGTLQRLFGLDLSNGLIPKQGDSNEEDVADQKDEIIDSGQEPEPVDSESDPITSADSIDIDQNIESAAAEEGEREAGEKSDESSDEQSKLPKMQDEEFIENWLQDKQLRRKLGKTIAELPRLTQATDDKEKALALACQVVLGDHSKSLDELAELSFANPQLKSLPVTLAWLPFELRSRIFTTLLKQADSTENFGRILRAYSRVQNPEAAKNIWAIADNSLGSLDDLQTSLVATYFGDSINSYESISKQSVPKSLLNFAKEEIFQYNDSQQPRAQQLALLLLQKLDLEHAKSIAQPLAESAEDIEIRDLAFRILLMPPTPNTEDYGSRPTSAETERARANAVGYLKTDEDWKFKTAIRFLAFGELALEASANPDIKTQLRLQSNYYYSSHDDSEAGKVRVPSVPTGLTLELLSPPNIEMDDELRALQTYFRALLDQNVDLKPLLDYFHSKGDNETVAKLVYQAIAMQNDDSLMPVVAEIYEKLGKTDNPSFSADLYWTIRMMDGKPAIRLRKKIRDEVGMSQLKSY